MKLLSIRVNNVRRFTQPVEIVDIGPGLNVLAAPNEHGKSTLFDALHALFFFQVTSWKRKEAASLAPHAGGNPEVTAEIEIKGETYRVSKVFSSRPGQRKVTVHRNGNLLKQAEDAEDWISELIKPNRDGGPAGLLWVRQGLTGLQSGKDDDTLAARRDLLSSVAGEIDDITGGRQMERIRTTLTDSLENYLTGTGSTRKHGPLWTAEQTVAELDEEMSGLRGMVGQLHDKLTERRDLQREKASLTDPAAIKEREDALEAARVTLDDARSYLDRKAKADKDNQVAQLTLKTHQDRLKTVKDQLAEFRAAESALAELQERVSGAEDQLAEAEKDLGEARAAEENARNERTSAERTRENVQAADNDRKGVERRRELTGQLKDARRHSAAAAAARNTIAAAPDAGQIERVEEAWQALELVQRARKASAAAITLTAEPDMRDRVTLDGKPLETGQRIALPEGGDIAIAGVGSIRVHPAAHRDEADLQRAREEFDAALKAAGCASLQSTRQAGKSRRAAEDTLRDADTKLGIAAPDGIQALMDEIAILPETVPEDENLPSQADADAAFDEAKEKHNKASANLEGALTGHRARQGDVRELRVRRDEAQHRLERASAAVDDPAERERELNDLCAKVPELEKDAGEARQRVQELDDSAPDMSLIEAGAQRAKSVVDAAEKRLFEIGKRLSVLEALINHEADLAVEEKLLEIVGKLEAAKSHAGRVQAEVKVLQRLDDALSEARQQAHDTYIGPIRKELGPLLRMILPGAELILDPDSVLPTGLSRPEGEDTYEQLSGGTQEQIALLVRLAFARLLIKSGTPAPVILDDAIVYTDDDRIERMFDALTQQAGDMQVIVLSCRQKVFRGLGGQTLSIRHAGAEASA